MSGVVRMRWRELALIVVAACSIVFMRKLLPSYAEQTALIPLHGELKQRVATADFAVAVQGVSLAHRYRIAARSGEGESRLLQTPGVWVAVPVTLEATRTQVAVHSRLRTRDGLLYAANDASRPNLKAANLAGRMVAPELPTVGAYFFEVPSDRLAGLRAEFYVGTQVPDVVVQVDLGLTGKTDAALNAGAAAEVVLQP